MTRQRATRGPDKKTKKVKWSPPSCVHVVVLTYPGGAIKRLVVSCGRWSCPTCSAKKVEDILRRINEATSCADLFMLEVTAEEWVKVRKAAQRKLVDYLAVKRYGSKTAVLVISDEPIAGRGWELQPAKDADVADAIQGQPVRRVDWSGGWRPEKHEYFKTLGRIYCSPGMVDEVLRRAGYDPKRGRIPGVSDAEAAARIEEALEVVKAEKSLVQGRGRENRDRAKRVRKSR